MPRRRRTQNQNWPYEDKIIISRRRGLEIFWFDRLSDANREAWLTRWLTNSPVDITGHVYTPYPTTRFLETHSRVDVVYAWSQIFGFYRFKNPAVFNPIGGVYPSPTCGNLIAQENVLTIDYDASATGLSSVDILVYASGNAPAGSKHRAPKVNSPNIPSKYHLRPMCAMTGQPPTGTLDFFDCYFNRYSGPDPLFLTATVALCNVNNELIRSLDIPTAIWND